MIKQRGSKRGALEMSIGTIVIIVLAMTMLILGLVLVKSIFSGATYNVKVMDEKVRGEINKLFVENKRMVVYLSDAKIDVKQGDDFGVGWAVKNLGQPGTMSYATTVQELSPQCQGLTQTQALTWIDLGRGATNIPFPQGGTPYADIVRLKIPDTAPLCLVRFQIAATVNGQPYDAEIFDVNVQAK